MATSSIRNKYSKLSKLGKITTKYGGQTRGDPNHQGIDIANKKGTPIPSFSEGTVVGVKNGLPKGGDSYGNSVIVRDNKGDSHRYSHLEKADVSVGQKVKENQRIGTMGDSGNSYSPSGGDASHLDYRILTAYGKYRDPSKRIRTKKQ